MAKNTISMLNANPKGEHIGSSPVLFDLLDGSAVAKLDIFMVFSPKPNIEPIINVYATIFNLTEAKIDIEEIPVYSTTSNTKYYLPGKHSDLNINARLNIVDFVYNPNSEEIPIRCGNPNEVLITIKRILTEYANKL